ncbi:hypothetical protein DQ04_01551100 [Trypanosoma grayi]|uniref:hypothetical protein n=1 Tax=Trypanosoma grayi TaxID=71804 RepID=UPI0004F40BFE|nr:hypothetical protein DQ04_01551100 [Trypanosoma grayi]KEG12655.1 hypothetical protein DQ04_01551100 [Trypanosoma grayi]
MAAVTELRRCGLDDFVTVLPVPPQTELRRGVLRFAGPTDFAGGMWVGVELVGTPGRNDGSVLGKSYFACLPGQGVFVRPELVVPYTPEAAGVAQIAPQEIHESLGLVGTLRHDIAQLQEELMRKEEALQQTREVLRGAETALEERAAELQKEKEEKQQTIEMLSVSQQHETAIREKDEEIQHLQHQFTDLKDLFTIQEEELQRQGEHADDLAQLVEGMRCERDEERRKLHEAIHRLEDEVAKQQAMLDAKDAVKQAEEADVEALRLQLFQQQQEKEALRLLRKRHEDLHAERERERQEHETKWKRAAADYEEALAQQREYKNRLLDDIRSLQQQIEDMRSSHERERALHVPLSMAEREEYESKLSQQQCELMQCYGTMFAKRYDHFLAPVSQWDLPAGILGAMSEAIASAERVLPFTTPEVCHRSRMALFQPHNAGGANSPPKVV